MGTRTAMEIHAANLVEHASHPYDATQAWLIMDANSEFVASATWHKSNPMDVSFNGATRHLICTNVVCAETDDLAALEDWASEKLAAGASGVRLYRTWLIEEGPHSGKRDNAVIVSLKAAKALPVTSREMDR